MPKKKVFLPYLMLVASLGCKQNMQYTVHNEAYSVRIEAAWNDLFCNIYINDDGKAKVVEGYYTSSNLMRYAVADTSKVFTLDSAQQFLTALKSVAAHPQLARYSSYDSPTYCIYQHGLLVYDGSDVGEPFWCMFRPIMGQLPDGYNPFYQWRGNPWQPESYKEDTTILEQ